jgi:hypothetical protein
LKTLPRTSKSREFYEARRKAKHDYISSISDAYQEGIEKGIGVIYLGIQLNLESRFNTKDHSILKELRRVKDIQKLTELLLQSAKVKTLSEFKKFLKD